jgi:hypothetical protein
MRIFLVFLFLFLFPATYKVLFTYGCEELDTFSTKARSPPTAISTTRLWTILLFLSTPPINISVGTTNWVTERKIDEDNYCQFVAYALIENLPCKPLNALTETL